MRKLKALGLAMLAVFAMSAVAAQGASAAASLTAESSPAALSGSALSPQVFKLTGLGVESVCQKVGVSGNVTSGSTTITVAPLYEDCKSFGLTSTIDVNGCHFLFHITGTLTPNVSYDGSADLTCAAGSNIVITAGIIGNRCEVDVEPQTGLTTIEGFNKTGTPKDVEIKANITGIKYTVTKDEGTCPLSKVGETRNDGDYTGSVTVNSSTGLSFSD